MSFPIYDGGRSAPLAGDNQYNRGGTQLTQLLSSVQASLAELKVEVSSARKLNFDAVLQKSGASSGNINRTQTQTVQLLQSGFTGNFRSKSLQPGVAQPDSPGIPAGSISFTDVGSGRFGHSGECTASKIFQDTSQLQTVPLPAHDSFADGLTYRSQQSMAALVDRISTLEQSVASSRDVGNKELTMRIDGLETEIKANQKSMQRLEESNRALTDQLENQRCAMLYIADDVKACSEELKELRDGGSGEGQQQDMAEMWAQIRITQQQSKDNEAQVRCVRDEIVDSIADRLNRLQNTVAELQLPKSAIPNPVGNISAKEAVTLQREVSECKEAVKVVRHLVEDSASQQTVNESMEEISMHVANMRTDMEAVQQQVYALKTSSVHEIVESRVADSLSQLRAEMSELSRDRSAEMQALAEQLTSAFNAITELESQIFTATEDHHVVMELHGQVQSLQHTLQNVHTQLQQVSSMRSAANVDTGDSTSQSRVEKLDVELAEVAATVQQLTASTTLLREQLMTVSAQSDHQLSDAIQAELRELGSSLQTFQEAQKSLQQAVSMHEQTVADISVRVDTLDSSVARSGAVAQAADSHSVLTDSSMQELRGTVETLQQAVQILSEPTSAGNCQVDTDVLSELRQDINILSQQVAALESSGNEGLTVLKQRVQDTESSLTAVLEKLGSISEDVSQVQSEAQQAARIEELSCTADALSSKVQDVEGAVCAATQDIRTILDTNCSVSNSLPDLQARVASVEAKHLENAEHHGVSELQNAVTLLAQKVDAKADCEQVFCLEKRLEAAEAVDERQPASTERLDIISEKLQHLDCRLDQQSTKLESDGQAVANLSSDLITIVQKVDCLQEGVNGSVNRSSELKNEVAQLSQNVETLSGELKTAVHSMVSSSPSEAAPNPKVIDELHCSIQLHQTELTTHAERFKQMEQQIMSRAEAQQVQDVLATVQDISNRLIYVESDSEGPLSHPQGALQEAVQEVQQKLLIVTADIESAKASCSSTMKIQSKCAEDVAGLFTQVNNITDRPEDPGRGESACLASSVEALQEQVQVLGNDIESYQQRSENVQNSGSAKLNELSNIVCSLRELVDAHAEKLSTLEASSERTEAADTSQAQEQKEHVDEALQQMAGQLSALTEVVGNTKADSAELREIVSAERNASSQMKEDMLADKLALEDRLEAVEEKLEDLGLNQLQHGHFTEASNTLRVNMSNTEHSDALPGTSKQIESIEQAQGKLEARLHELCSRIEEVASHTAALSAEVGDTTVSCSTLQESMKMTQNAILELHLDPENQSLALPAAQELSLRVAALDEQLEDIKASYNRTSAGNEIVDQSQEDTVVELLAAQKATSDALDAFKLAVADQWSAAAQMSHLTEMRADLESELHCIRNSLLQTDPSELEERVTSLERRVEADNAVAQHSREARLLQGTPMVMMQVIPQDVVGSVTVESVTPDGNLPPVESAAVPAAAGSPRSSLSSIRTDIQSHECGFTLFRTNDLFTSGAQPGNSVEPQELPVPLSEDCHVADSEKKEPQHSQCLWQENPEYSANDSASMKPQIDIHRDTASSTATVDRTSCMDQQFTGQMHTGGAEVESLGISIIESAQGFSAPDNETP